MIKTHSKSCNVDAFSYITGIPVERFVEIIGHDGKAEGFATQEITDVLLQHGFAVTPIERCPVARNPVTGQDRFVYPVQIGANRWKDQLTNSRGVLHGFSTITGLTHAVAWDGLKEGLIGTDPASFDPHVLWKVTKIDETH